MAKFKHYQFHFKIYNLLQYILVINLLWNASFQELKENLEF